MHSRGGRAVASSAAVKRKIRQPGADGPGPTPTREVLRCGSLRVDAATRQAEIAGVPLDLQPKVFDLLLVLLREPRVVHTRDALFHRLWPGAVVLDATLTAAISQLRRAFDAPNRARLRTVPKVGYAFDGEVEVEVDLAADVDGPLAAAGDGHAAIGSVAPATPTIAPAPPFDAAPPPRRARGVLPWAVAALFAVLLAGFALRGPTAPERPILVVGPIQSETGATASRWLALAVRDGLLRRLGADPALRVVDHAQAIGATLVAGARAGGGTGADYVLEVRYAPGPSLQDPVALSMVLRDARDDAPAWRFAQTAAPGDLLLRVDEMADAVRMHILPDRPPLPPAMTVPIAAVDAYTEGLRALAKGDYREARRELERAAQLAPGFAAAEVRLAEVLRDIGHQSLAAALYRQIAAADDGAPTEARRLAKARALALDGAHADAATAFRALATDYPDDPRHAIEGARALAKRDVAGRAEALRILERLASQATLADWNIQRLMAIGMVEELAGRHAAGAAAFAKARDVADAAGLAGAAGDAGLNHGNMLLRLDQVEHARQAWERAARDYERAGLSLGQAVATLNLLLTARWSTPPPDPATVREGIRDLAARARDVGATQLEAMVNGILAEDHLMAAQPEAALPLAARAASQFDRLGAALQADQMRLIEARAHLDRGTPGSALAVLDPVSQRLQAGTPHHHLANQVRVRVLLETGDIALARRLADETVAASTAGGDRGGSAVAQCIRTNALRAAGDEGAAKAALRACRGGAHAAAAPSVDMVEAEMAQAAGDSARTRSLLQRATEAIDAMPAGGERERLALQLTQLLLRLGAMREARERFAAIDAGVIAHESPPARAQYAVLEAILLAYVDRDLAGARAALARARSLVDAQRTVARVELDLYEAALLDPRDAPRRARLLADVQAFAARAGHAPLGRLADALADAIAAAPDAPPDGDWLVLAGGLPQEAPRLRVQPRP